MTTDLEQLVRDTLGDRAATVTDGPRWVRPARGARQTRWLAPAAAAAAVVLVAGGAATWQTVATRRQTSASAATCAGTLPATWRNGLGTPVLPAVPGQADQFTQAALGWIDKTKFMSGTTPPPPSVSLREIYHIPADRNLRIVLAGQDPWAVLFVIATGRDPRPGRPHSDVINLGSPSHPSIDLSLKAPGVPAGWTVSSGEPGLVAGVVYWGMQPAGASPRQGVVVTYTLATKTYRILARTAGAPELVQDARGVSWRDGHVSLSDLPKALPRLRDWDGRSPRTSVATNGASFAWIDPARPNVVQWADRAGHAHSYRVELPGRPNAAPLPPVVSGSFVFLTWKTAGKPRSFVLDVRTGALVDINAGLGADAAQAALYSDGGLTAFTLGHVGNSLKLRVVRTASLPELHC